MFEFNLVYVITFLFLFFGIYLAFLLYFLKRNYSYLLIPFICITFWALLPFKYFFNDIIDIPLSIHGDFIAFYSAGEMVLKDPRRLYEVADYYYMPFFAVLMALFFNLYFNYYESLFILYFVNYVCALFCIYEFDKKRAPPKVAEEPDKVKETV
ncbi:MAG: hypothetical protein ACFFAO_09240 [Candidatus Hermodarchaeota archaeon]